MSFCATNTVSRCAILFFTAMFLFVACEKTPANTRLRRREVLYEFTKKDNGCTVLWGQGGVKRTTPKELLATVEAHLSDLGYIEVHGGRLFIDLPWPFHDIDEAAAVQTTEQQVRITGSQGNIEFTFTALPLDADLSVVQVNGQFCDSMPQMFKENVMANCIKNIVKRIRDVRE